LESACHRDAKVIPIEIIKEKKEKLKLKSLRENNHILDMQILQSPKKQVVQSPKLPAENNQNNSNKKPLKSLRESS
jgi:hypothetical protein